MVSRGTGSGRLKAAIHTVNRYERGLHLGLKAYGEEQFWGGGGRGGQARRSCGPPPNWHSRCGSSACRQGCGVLLNATVFASGRAARRGIRIEWARACCVTCGRLQGRLQYRTRTLPAAARAVGQPGTPASRLDCVVGSSPSTLNGGRRGLGRRTPEPGRDMTSELNRFLASCLCLLRERGRARGLKRPSLESSASSIRSMCLSAKLGLLPAEASTRWVYPRNVPAWIRKRIRTPVERNTPPDRALTVRRSSQKIACGRPGSPESTASLHMPVPPSEKVAALRTHSPKFSSSTADCIAPSRQLSEHTRDVANDQVGIPAAARVAARPFAALLPFCGHTSSPAGLHMHCAAKTACLLAPAPPLRYS